MPRYFFTLHDGEIIPDTEGTELNSLEDAKAEAAATVMEYLQDKGYSALWNGKDWKVVVTDEGGMILCTMRFNANVEEGLEPDMQPAD